MLATKWSLVANQVYIVRSSRARPASPPAIGPEHSLPAAIAAAEESAVLDWRQSAEGALDLGAVVKSKTELRSAGARAFGRWLAGASPARKALRALGSHALVFRLEQLDGTVRAVRGANKPRFHIL